MLYNIVLVYAIQQRRLAIINTGLPSLLSLPSSTPSHPSRSSEQQSGLPGLSSNFASAIDFTRCSIHMSMLLFRSSHSLYSHCDHSLFSTSESQRREDMHVRLRSTG